MSEVSLYTWMADKLDVLTPVSLPRSGVGVRDFVKSLIVQGYLAHKKTHPPLGPPLDPRHRPTVGS